MTNLLAVPKKIMSVLVPVKFCQAKWAHLLSRGSAIVGIAEQREGFIKAAVLPPGDEEYGDRLREAFARVNDGTLEIIELPTVEFDVVGFVTDASVTLNESPEGKVWRGAPASMALAA